MRMLRPRRSWIATLCLLAVMGCDSLLEVDTDPEVVDATKETTLTETMVGAAVDFFRAVDGAISYAGLFGDEYVSTAPGPQHRAVDARMVTSTDQSGATGGGRGSFYIPLQRLVAVSQFAQDRILAGEFAEIPNPSPAAEEYARLAFYKGVAKLYLADIYCTAAFLGTGPELTTEEVYAQAAADLTETIDATDAEPELREAARLLRARIRLILGDDGAAMSDAQAVDPTFEFYVDFYSTATEAQNNWLYQNTLGPNATWSVAPRFRGLAVDDTGMPDARTELLGPFEPVFDKTQEAWAAAKSGSPAAPIRIASGDEARYIIAEIQGGQTAVDIINEIRARHGIDEVWSPSGGAPNEVRDKLIEERFRTLFLEGAHLGDLRRYIDRYGLDLFPTTTPQGIPMGTQTCMPMPAIERDNNPDL